MSLTKSVLLICSPRPRTAVHSGRAGGNAWWKRDVFHIAAPDYKTLCGLKTTGWLEIERREESSAKSDAHICTHCARKLHTI